jgi:cytoskeletal protein CcmA (bactofilin family)
MSASGRVRSSTIDPANERRTVAWLGRSVVVKGDLVSSEDLMISGQIEGTIMAKDHALVIGPEAVIRADIQARSVTIHGKVVGQITAGERIEVGASGSVKGNLTAPRMAVSEGAVLQGRVGVGSTGDGRRGQAEATP